jgi:hypothetical protein
MSDCTVSCIRHARMTSSGMPVFSARVALCSTWLAGAKRFSKNSRRVGFADIFGSGPARRSVAIAGVEQVAAAGAHPQLLRLALGDLGDRGKLGFLLLGGDQPVQRFFHVVLERVGFLLRGHQRHRGRPTEARHERATIDLHEVPPLYRRPVEIGWAAPVQGPGGHRDKMRLRPAIRQARFAADIRLVFAPRPSPRRRADGRRGAL